MHTNYTQQDYFARKAKSEGYSARSVYKLQEIHKKYLSLKHCKNILDIGAAPGSWTQYLQKNINSEASIVAIDIQPLHTKLMDIPPVHFIQGDFTSPSYQQNLHILGPYDIIVSDAAPKTSGNKNLDCARSEEIVYHVLQIAKISLKKNGSMIVKIFQGSGIEDILQELKHYFNTIIQCKPKAVRPHSFEKFIICS